MDIQKIKITIDSEEEIRLDKAITQNLPEEIELSRSRVSELIKTGRIYLQGKAICSPSYLVKKDQVFEIILPPVVDPEIRPENIPLKIIYEDKELIVIDKPPGMIVHPGAGNPNNTLVNALIHHCGKSIQGVGGKFRPGIVHRLDKGTSGLIVAAKSDKAMNSLSKQFATKMARRFYFALIHGTPIPSNLLNKNPSITFEKNGWVKIETFIERHSASRIKFSVSNNKGKQAITRFRVLNSYESNKISEVECALETGRTHQIRVHLEFIGHPIVGDPLYTGTNPLNRAASNSVKAKVEKLDHQMLRAIKLQFIHPVLDKEMHFEVPVGKEIEEFLELIH